MPLTESKGNMYPGYKTWNPLAGECPHKCKYCSTHSLMRYPVIKAGIQRVEKIPLERAIEEVFNVPKGSLTDKHRKREKCDAKHLYRYIIERLLKSGILADNDKQRTPFGRGRYYLYVKKLNKYYAKITSKEHGVLLSMFYPSEAEAKEAVRNVLSKRLSDIFCYSLPEIGVLTNCTHCSVLHSCKTARNLFETDKTYRAKAQTIFDRITNNQIILP